VTRLEYADQVQFDRSASAVRKQLGDAAFAACHADGRAMALEAVMAEASAGRSTDN